MPIGPRQTARAGATPFKSRLKKSAKRILGRMLLPLRPDIRRTIEAKGVERYRLHYRDASIVDRLVLAALIDQYTAEGKQEAIVRSHHEHWASDEVVAQHASLAGRFSSAFLGKHYPMVEALDRFLATGRYHTLCEIGCGSGLVIDYMAKRWPALRELIGLDLSAQQTALNRQRFGDPRLRFVAGDASDWIPKHARPGTVFVTYDGVLEYFTQPILEAVLRALASRPPICFAIVEPIDPDYDLASETDSRLFGGEMSFSHNYPRVFAAAGFHIRWQQELPLGRYLMMIATVGDDDAHIPGQNLDLASTLKLKD